MQNEKLESDSTDYEDLPEDEEYETRKEIDDLSDFRRLRNLVRNAKSFVKNLEKCNDVFKSVVENIKEKLRKAHVLVVTLESAQGRAMKQLTHFEEKEKAVQASFGPMRSTKITRTTQTAGIDEILLDYILTTRKFFAELPQEVETFQIQIKDPFEGVKEDEPKTSKSEIIVKEIFPELLSGPGSFFGSLLAVGSYDDIKAKRTYTKFTLICLFITMFINLLLYLAIRHGFNRLDFLRSLEDQTRSALERFIPNCTSPPQVKNGQYSCKLVRETALYSRFERNIILCQFSCDFGYQATTIDPIKCTTTRKWIGQVSSCSPFPCSSVIDRDCAGLFRMQRARGNGIYNVTSCGDRRTFSVYCNFAVAGGGWTAIQRRLGGHVSFKRSYKEFELFFGDYRSSYWIGLQTMHSLTSTEPQSLLILLTDWAFPYYQTQRAYAWYRNFSVGNKNSSYQLQIGNYSFISTGFDSAGDSMRQSNAMQFSAIDYDQDLNSRDSCARIMGSAWWHNDCTEANLNAEYIDYSAVDRKTIHWKTWRHFASLRTIEMYVRPRNWR